MTNPSAYVCDVVSASKVVEDGVEAPIKRASQPRWGWLAAGLFIGAGISVMVLRVDQIAPSPSSTTAEQDAVAAEGGIGEVVEGFPDGLITTVRADGRSLEVLVWPVAGEPYERTIPVGSSNPPNPVGFDLSGRRMATILPLPGEAHGVLYAGAPENAAIVETGVTGYAWHDSELRALAYTTFEDSELQLWIMTDQTGGPQLVTKAVGIEGGVAFWGDWGFAVEDELHDSIVLFTAEGLIKDTNEGQVLASHESGWLAIDNEGIDLLSAGGGLNGLEGVTLSDNPVTARFSPDRSMLAVTTARGMVVVSLADDRVVATTEERPGVASRIEWSSDSRFVLYPAVRGLEVLDTDSGEERRVLTTQTFTGVGVLPLVDS